jgi:hypothetical protein
MPAKIVSPKVEPIGCAASHKVSASRSGSGSGVMIGPPRNPRARVSAGDLPPHRPASPAPAARPAPFGYRSPQSSGPSKAVSPSRMDSEGQRSPLPLPWPGTGTGPDIRYVRTPAERPRNVAALIGDVLIVKIRLASCRRDYPPAILSSHSCASAHARSRWHGRQARRIGIRVEGANAQPLWRGRGRSGHGLRHQFSDSHDRRFGRNGITWFMRPHVEKARSAMARAVLCGRPNRRFSLSACSVTMSG